MTYYCRHWGKPPSFCHRHINHLERCFPGQSYFVLHSKKQLLEAHSQWMLLLCSLAMIYKWESICYNWVSSRLTSLIFCCSSSASPHPSLAFSEAAFLALCDNWIKIFFWQLKYCSVAFLSTAYLGYSRAFTVSHNTWRSLNYIMMTGYLLENFKGFGKTMKALNERVFRFVFNIM